MEKRPARARKRRGCVIAAGGRSSTVKAPSSVAAPSVLGEAGGMDVEVDAGVKVVPMITISEERDGVLSILASSSKPEGTSVSSSGLDMSVRSKSGRPAGAYEMRL